ncbi:CHAD domain-containing protein [Trinickia acidisoli]|uniref:CHAD domain-containing protein n=1 Tax=Trinickia acidisoli TaxID=2767482 RepID=UPI001A8E4B22|nr:CHAD domain-containing protein [Trinickia acidisoli]
MSGTVELVLAVERAAASAWMAGPIESEGRGRATRQAAAHREGSAAEKVTRASRGSPGAQAKAREDIGAAIADALSRMPGIAELHAVEPWTVRAFVEPHGAWRVTLLDAEDGVRRITATRANEATPGVWRCETMCDEPFEAGAPLALNDAIPPSLRDVLGKPDKLAQAPTLVVRRGIWRWSGADGAVVDIELHDARDATSAVSDRLDGATAGPIAQTGSTAPAADAKPIAFCELRLSAHVEGGQRSIEVDPSTAAAQAEFSEVIKTSAAAPAPHPEPAAAALQALFTVAGMLADTLPIFPTLTDGYARACVMTEREAPARAARIDVSDAKRPHDALIEVGANVARQWFGNEAGVRDGTDAEFVHQMRVAMRRLKTLLKTFPRWVDEMWKRTVAPDLDWLAGLLGQARDLDVFVDTMLPALAAADVDATTWQSLQTRAAARRDEARAQVREALRTRRYAALSLAWLRWLAVQRLSSGPPAMADKALTAYAAKRARKHYVRLVAKPVLTSLTPAERHRRRIEAKRLRYTLEFFESRVSRKTRRKVAKQLGRIQSVLGDGSDATAALRFLEALDVPPYEHGFARGWCEAVNRWSAAEGERLLQDLGKPKIVREP